jgi:hypothetical protein
MRPAKTPPPMTKAAWEGYSRQLFILQFGCNLWLFPKEMVAKHEFRYRNAVGQQHFLFAFQANIAA